MGSGTAITAHVCRFAGISASETLMLAVTIPISLIMFGIAAAVIAVCAWVFLARRQ